jgi:hypothetical protein
MGLLILKKQNFKKQVHGISSKAQRNRFSFFPILFVALQT